MLWHDYPVNTKSPLHHWTSWLQALACNPVSLLKELMRMSAMKLVESIGQHWCAYWSSSCPCNCGGRYVFAVWQTSCANWRQGWITLRRLEKRDGLGKHENWTNPSVPGGKERPPVFSAWLSHGTENTCTGRAFELRINTKFREANPSAEICSRKNALPTGKASFELSAMNARIWEF